MLKYPLQQLLTAADKRKCWNRQTGTFEVRVSMTCGFKSHLPHQKNRQVLCGLVDFSYCMQNFSARMTVTPEYSFCASPILKPDGMTVFIFTSRAPRALDLSVSSFFSCAAGRIYLRTPSICMPRTFAKLYEFSGLMYASYECAATNIFLPLTATTTGEW